MYIVSDIVEMGAADNLILSDMKDDYQFDDLAEQTMVSLEYFDD